MAAALLCKQWKKLLPSYMHVGSQMAWALTNCSLYRRSAECLRCLQPHPWGCCWCIMQDERIHNLMGLCMPCVLGNTLLSWNLHSSFWGFWYFEIIVTTALLRRASKSLEILTLFLRRNFSCKTYFMARKQYISPIDANYLKNELLYCLV